MDADDWQIPPIARSVNHDAPTRPEPANFPTTCWSWISSAGASPGPDAKEAFDELCRMYWHPIYSMIRRKGYNAGDAADLTQDYFARLLDGRLMRVADRGRGRFRTLLRTDCRYFLADEVDRRTAVKRGGGRTSISIDADGERRFLLAGRDEDDPEQMFDRVWALTLLDRAHDRLACIEVKAGRTKAFEHLQGTLTGHPRPRPYGEIAERLGMSVDAVQAAVVRLRRRYRDALRTEIAATLKTPTPDLIDDEIRDLIAALTR